MTNGSNPKIPRMEVFQMPTIRFTKHNWPQSSEEFKRILREAWEKSRPMDDFVELVRELTLLEQKYGIDSAEFYDRYQQGKMGDDMEIMHWASTYEIYREMKGELDNVLYLLERYALPAGT
jgi:hypothetical protein